MEKLNAGKVKDTESMHQGDKKKIRQQDGLKRLVDSGAKHEQLEKLMSEMISLKKEIVRVKDEIKAVKRKEMKQLEEKSHSLELQLGQEKETRMRLESTIEGLQEKILQEEEDRKDIGQEAETLQNGRDMGKWWNPFKGEEAETGGMSWPKQTFVYGTGTNMQQSMSLLSIFMITEMLNGFRQFNLGIQS